MTHLDGHHLVKFQHVVCLKESFSSDQTTEPLPWDTGAKGGRRINKKKFRPNPLMDLVWEKTQSILNASTFIVFGLRFVGSKFITFVGLYLEWKSIPT